MRVITIVVGVAVGIWSMTAHADPDLPSLALHACQSDPALTQASALAARAQVNLARAAADKAAADKAKIARPPATVQAEAAALALLTDTATQATAAVAQLQHRRDVFCAVDWHDYRNAAGAQLKKAHAELFTGAAATAPPPVITDLPRQYLELDLPGVGVCSALLDLELPTTDEGRAVAHLCARSTDSERSLGADSVAINLVQGLGDLLQAEAKAEVMQYLLEQIGQRFCTYQLTIAKLKTTIAMKAWFADSCKTMLPDGKIASPDAFTFGDLEVAFKHDLDALPGKLGGVLQTWLTTQSKATEAWIAVAGVLAAVVFEAAEHKTPLEILKDFGDRTDSATKGVSCDLTSGTASKECAALLLFQLARTAAAEYASPLPPPSQVIGDAIDAFCAIHGGAKAKNGACVVDRATYLVWHTRLLAFYRAIKQWMTLQADLDRMKNQASSQEASKRAAPELADALRQLVHAFADIVENLPGLPAADKAEITDELGFLAAGVEVYAGIVTGDAVQLRTALLALLATPFVASKLSSDEAHAVTVVISLATAKDRAEAKSLLADVTAPVGSYKVKYGARHPVVMVNGFVGVMAGGEYRLHQRDTASATGWVPFKLSAPVGFDVTLASWSCWHLGLTATLIDPLALAVSTANDTVSAEWKTLVNAGVYARIGLFKSPLVVLVGGNYQPGRRADAGSCGAERCYDGAFQLGAMLSADVPLFQLH